MVCAECGLNRGWRTYHCPRCSRGQCGQCFDWPIIEVLPPADHKPTRDFSGKAEYALPSERDNKGWTVSAIPLCRKCFTASLNYDVTRHTDVIEPSERAGAGAPTIVFGHGGGGSRMMYGAIAPLLAARGIRCVLTDFPGHGSQVDVPLSLESCIAHLDAVTRAHCPADSPLKPVYFGASFGGFTGMEFLAKHGDLYAGAVIACASQQVGEGAGFKAKAGVVLFTLMSHLLSSTTISKALLGAVRGAKHLDLEMAQISFRGGFYFQSSIAQLKTLKSIDSLVAMEGFKGPMLLLNGSEDHRNMLTQQLAIAKAHSPISKSVVYQGCDHFFMMDTRAVPKMLDDIVQFLHAVHPTWTPLPV